MTADLPIADDNQAGPEGATALPLRAWFPDIEVPAGLTLEDLARAARLVRGWEHDDEWSGIPVVVRIYRELRSAEEGNLRRSRVPQGES